jgi:hypothetical protein
MAARKRHVTFLIPDTTTAIFAQTRCSGEMPGRVVCEKPVSLRPGDIFLLCSDGRDDKNNIFRARRIYPA